MYCLDVLRMGRTCRSAQLFHSSSPSFCVSSSPLIQPLSEYCWVTWYARRCNDFLQEPSFASCLWESKRSISVVLDEKGSDDVHQFHNHILLVLHYSRIFFWSLLAWALGREICLFVYLYNYECKSYCSVSFSSVCKTTEKCNVLNATFLLTR